MCCLARASNQTHLQLNRTPFNIPFTFILYRPEILCTVCTTAVVQITDGVIFFLERGWSLITTAAAHLSEKM